jgi:tetratricopeptide (TPR) repeat protein
MYPRQLDIFSSPDILYNRAIDELLKLRPDEAEVILDKWVKQYPDRRPLDLEKEMIRFLQDSRVSEALEKDPETAFTFWNSTWEARWEKRPEPDELIDHFRRVYFERLAEVILRDTAVSGLKNNSPFYLDGRGVLCLLRACLWTKAVALAREAVSQSHVPGRLYGYLGDALYQQELLDSARQAYIQALFLEPDDVDLTNLSDPKVCQLVTNPCLLLDDEEYASGPWKNETGWAAAIGLLYGVFRPPRLEDQEDARQLWDMLSAANRIDNKETHIHPGRAFAAGIVLSEQAVARLEYYGLDLVSIRQYMKAMEPRLFSLYMRKFLSLRPSQL